MIPKHVFNKQFIDSQSGSLTDVIGKKNSVHIKEGGLIWSSGVPVDPRK
jgi:hypothetical protein